MTAKLRIRGLKPFLKGVIGLLLYYVGERLCNSGGRNEIYSREVFEASNFKHS